jgi:hypothetical protein
MPLPQYSKGPIETSLATLILKSAAFRNSDDFNMTGLRIAVFLLEELECLAVELQLEMDN